MELKRTKYKYLNEWRNRKNRKPLVVRGARQVGKTTLIKDFGKTYEHFIYLNLELEKDRQIFESLKDVKVLLDTLLFEYRILLEDIENTLLFIDEIQEEPRAISMLRYFYEEIPELHLIAAGSLLEHALRKVKSFPVGRIEYLYLYPLNFREFLFASDQKLLLERLDSLPAESEALHRVAIDWFHKYAIVGGMPEVVMEYLENEAISDTPRIYESIWKTYKEDVVKYAKSETEAKIMEYIIQNSPYFLDQRVTFENFGGSNYRSREVSESFRSLDKAKIIQLIYPTTSLAPPVIPDIRKRPRLQFLDTGIVNYAANIQTSLMSLKDLSSGYKGALIPHLIFQELISIQTFTDNNPHFWVREKRQSDAEVDLVIAHQGILIPVEIKSGKAGHLRSLHQFMDRCDHPFAVRIYGGRYAVHGAKTQNGKSFYLMNLPYYLGTYLYEYIEYFVLTFE